MGTHGGTTVRITSSNAGVVLLAPDGTTVGAGALEVFVPAGQTWFAFWVQGIETGAGRTVTLTATGAGFMDATSTVAVRPAVYDIQGLNASATAGGASDPFLVRLGAAISGADLRMQQEMGIRAGGATRTATLVVTDPTVAELVTLVGAGGEVTVQIGAGQARSSSTVASGGVELRPLAAGTVTVTGSIPDLLPAPEATRSVMVGQAAAVPAASPGASPGG